MGLSVTITKEGLFDEALIKPQDPSSKVNLIPLTVNILAIFSPSIFTLSVFNFFILLVNSSIKPYFYSSLQKGAIVGL